MSQQELAKFLNVAIMTIHRWEKGTHNPDSKEKSRVENLINNENTFIDPYEVLIEEINILQTKIEDLKIYLERFHA